MSWEDARKAKEGSKFIETMKDGEHFIAVFRGEPSVFYKAYPDKNEYQDWAEGRARRFKIVAVVKEDEEYVAKVWEGSKTTLVDLFNANEEYGMDCVYKIKRVGTEKETTYAVLFQKKLTKEELSKINALDLPSLSSGRARSEEEPPPPSDEDFNQEVDEPEEENIPF